MKHNIQLRERTRLQIIVFFLEAQHLSSSGIIFEMRKDFSTNYVFLLTLN